MGNYAKLGAFGAWGAAQGSSQESSAWSLPQKPFPFPSLFPKSPGMGDADLEQSKMENLWFSVGREDLEAVTFPPYQHHSHLHRAWVQPQIQSIFGFRISCQTQIKPPTVVRSEQTSKFSRTGKKTRLFACTFAHRGGKGRAN